jgi:multiple sugar transport system permease protein
VYAIRLSFFKVSLDFSQTFIGIKNFTDAFKDPYFVNSVKITFIYTIASVLISLFIGIFIGMIVALILNTNWIKGTRLLNLIFLIPWTISYVATGATWKWILNAQYGVFNVLLRQLGLITANISFFGSLDLALPAVIFVNVWKNMPFAVVMILAGLQSIPEDQVEAALVDGASAFQVFMNIKLPNLRNVLSVTTVLLTIWIFVQFDLTQVLTDGGGPGHATELLSNLIYRVSFNYYQFGYGSAIAVLMLIIVLILTVVYMQVLDHE